MECGSHSITILDSRPQTTHSQQYHRKSIHTFLLQQLAQQLQKLQEEILFSHIMNTLNDTFEKELAQEDEDYKSGSEILNIPTPLQRAPQIYHISISENLSFDPTTALTTAE